MNEIMMTDKEQIRELYRTYWKCMIEKDVMGLKSIQTSDYELRHMTGVRQSREEFLNGLVNGTFNYYSAEHDSITVDINGDTAQMTGKSRVVAAVYGGSRSMWRLRGDFTLRKVNGGWKMSSSKASTY
jgi:ketosteroid isomerase-like protein